MSTAKQSMPLGWTTCSLGEVIPKPRNKIKPSKTSKLPFIGMDHIEANGFALIGQDDFSKMKSAGSHFLPGDVLYGRLRPYLNKVHTAKFEGASSAEFIVLPSSNLHISDFVRFLLHQRSFVRFASENSTGDRPRVDFDTLAKFQFELPPLNEQARIVSKIDELFSSIEAGEKALQRAKILVERYRKSVLKAAVTGELTKDWRENNKDKIEPANKLLERILKSRREAWEKSELTKMKAKGKQPNDDAWKKKYVEPAAPDTKVLPDLPEDWIWTSVDQLTSLITSGSRGWKEHYAESGAKFIRAQNINQEFLDETDIAFVSLPSDAEGLRTRVFQHDVLVTITGANVTKSALVEDDIGEAYVNQHVALLRPSLKELAEYLFVWLKAPEAGRTQLEEAAYGAGKPGLSLSNIKEVSVALPPIAEMKMIVSLAGVLGEKIDDCLTSILQQDRSTAVLRQSVLKSAFEGKLVPQEPSDEPASALLDRIRSATVSRKSSKPPKDK